MYSHVESYPCCICESLAEEDKIMNALLFCLGLRQKFQTSLRSAFHVESLLIIIDVTDEELPVLLKVAKALALLLYEPIRKLQLRLFRKPCSAFISPESRLRLNQGQN